jgi:hypothetical protein
LLYHVSGVLDGGWCRSLPFLGFVPHAMIIVILTKMGRYCWTW